MFSQIIFTSLKDVPNDTFYGGYQQAKLAKISAEAAWSITHGSKSVIVGILDTGVNTAHPDFMPNLWSGQNNPDPKNFTTTPHSTNIYDGNGHGSNVASIVGAKGNNGLYLSGVSWIVSLMHLKVLTDGTRQDPSHGDDDWTIDAINYARTHGASAINLSYGGYVIDNLSETRWISRDRAMSWRYAQPVMTTRTQIPRHSCQLITRRTM